ncbi:hypothetical protein [Streptomyces yanii]|uniref:Uncharacterized protein n=1 Tax=Streptomyces yanii TaxID=78510 RepID=A0ABV5R521_9ACTN
MADVGLSTAVSTCSQAARNTLKERCTYGLVRLGDGDGDGDGGLRTVPSSLAGA